MNSFYPQKHLIGRFRGPNPGPLLITLGGIHGNEPAGVRAIEIVLEMLEHEPAHNPTFSFRGTFLGLLGNVRAFEMEKRYLEFDLNRRWDNEYIDHVKHTPPKGLEPEDIEMLELLALIKEEVEYAQPTNIIFLDIHTTSAIGGIFSIATDDPESLRLAIELHAPVIKGILTGMKGTTLHYFTADMFGIDTVGVCFEAGQHIDPLSIKRAIAAIVNCMRSVGCVRPEDVENRHDQLLIDYSRGLPQVADFILAHTIKKTDGFRMRPGYKNFQRIKKGEILAYDKDGPIEAVEDGCILMPLYQMQGQDGFFLIEPVI